MAVVSSTMQSALMAVFTSSMTDDMFANAIASGFNNMAAAGQISAAPMSGTVSAGVFTGSGMGTMTTNVASSDITPITDQMKQIWKDIANWYKDQNWTDDSVKSQLNSKINEAKNYQEDYLASELAEVIDDKCTNATFNVLVNGTAVMGQVTTPIVGAPSKVTWTGDKNTLESSLKSALHQNSNSAVASSIASACAAYLISATIKVDGSGQASGAVGSGIMS